MGKFTGEFREKPWLSDVAIDILDTLIEPNWRIIETGSGASTLWMAERAEVIITFEHKISWANAIQEESNKRNHLNHHSVNIILDPEYPKTGVSRGIQEISSRRDYDLALIDGRGRVKSCRTVAPFIRPGGWLVLDNANRPRYEGAIKMLVEKYGCQFFSIIGKIMPENKRGFTTFFRFPQARWSKTNA